jgi:hypothetical protein
VNSWALDIVEVPPGVVTVTSAAPADRAGELTVIWVAEATVNDVAAVVPKVTAVAPVKLVPVIVTEVPPASGPTAGVTLETAGTGRE